VTLDREESLRLLATANIGRIVVESAGCAPIVRPVNYWFDEASQSLMFRSTAGGKLSALKRSNRIAFEVDEFDSASQTGWSVVVIGPLEELSPLPERTRLDHDGPSSWVDGPSACLLRLRPTVVSGRRIVSA
jgi:uncharacterized protein